MNEKPVETKRNRVKIRILTTAVVLLSFAFGFSVVCICGLRTRVFNMQHQLELFMAIEEENLLPCPMCNRAVDMESVDDCYFRIVCESSLYGDGCGMTTGLYTDKNELVDAWNGLRANVE